MQKGSTRCRFDATPANITYHICGEGTVKHGAETANGAAPLSETAQQRYERLLERMVDRLPGHLQTGVRWLRRPALRWIRLVAGVLFVAGAFLSILPLFGIWMLPLGLMLLAEDIPPLRRVRNRCLDWMERHRPHWFAGSDAGSRTEVSPPRSSSNNGGARSAATHQ
jgi:hypothetical protein